MKTELARTFADLVFPPKCVGCAGLVEAGPLRHVCATCATLIRPVEAPHCKTCGHPFYGEVEGERMCPHCEGLKPWFGEGRVLTLYRGAAKALIQELKYHRGLFVLEDMATLAKGHRYFAEFVAGARLVPVPLHPRKERERGFNQSRLWAETLAEAVGSGAVVEPVLRRVEDGDSQTTFDRKSRRERLKNAFALAPGADINPSSRYLLVDDVFTTGSTLNSCARVLRRAGALNVDVVTFGHG